MNVYILDLLYNSNVFWVPLKTFLSLPHLRGRIGTLLVCLLCLFEKVLVKDFRHSVSFCW